MFDYDVSAPLDTQEAGAEKRGDVRVLDLTYASPMGGRVPAYLILPSGEGKRPAVLFLHPGQGNRSTFVDEAVELARDHGIVSLTIDAPFLRPENQERRKQAGPFNPELDRREAIQAVVDLRRGFDLLAARPEVDPKRMVYVGHSLGATLGGTLAGIEKRPVAYVLMAGFPSMTRSYSHGENQVAAAFKKLLSRERQETYVEVMAPLDAVHYIGRAAPAKILFQFAREDEFLTSSDAEVYVQAASEPKEVGGGGAISPGRQCVTVGRIGPSDITRPPPPQVETWGYPRLSLKGRLKQSHRHANTGCSYPSTRVSRPSTPTSAN